MDGFKSTRGFKTGGGLELNVYTRPTDCYVCEPRQTACYWSHCPVTMLRVRLHTALALGSCLLLLTVFGMIFACCAVIMLLSLPGSRARPWQWEGFEVARLKSTPRLGCCKRRSLRRRCVAVRLAVSHFICFTLSMEMHSVSFSHQPGKPPVRGSFVSLRDKPLPFVVQVLSLMVFGKS